MSSFRNIVLLALVSSSPIGAQTAAVWFGAELPPAAHLEMAGPLALVGLLARSTPTPSSVIAAGGAVAVVAVLPGLPWHSTVLVATVAGIAAAVVAPTLRRRHAGRDEVRDG